MIGTITYPASDSLLITFGSAGGGAGDSTLLSDVQSLIQSIAYRNTNLSNPDSTGVRTVNWWLNDGDGNKNGGDSLSSVTTTVDVLPVNDAPVIANLHGDAVVYTEGGDSVYLDAGTAGLVSDLDDPISGSTAELDYSDGYLAVSINSGGVNAEDTLVLGNSTLWTIGTGPYTINRASGNTSHLIGTITYPASDSLLITFGSAGGGAGDSTLLSDVQSLIQSIAYRNTNLSNPDSTGVRTVNWWLNDGDGNKNGGDSLTSVTTTIDVSPINDQPEFANLLNDTDNYTEDGDSVFLDVSQNALISDLDNPLSGTTDTLDYTGGSLSIYINSDGIAAEDTLFIGGNQYDVTGSVIRRSASNPIGNNTYLIGTWSETTADSLVIDFNGTPGGGVGDSVRISDVQSLIRSIVYKNINSGNPDTTNVRQILWTLEDGDGNQGGLGDSLNTEISYVDVIAINDAPALGADSVAVIDAIEEDTLINDGYTIAAIIAQLDYLDADSIIGRNYIDSAGIAVFSVDDVNGQWQYTINDGANWNPVAPGTNNSRLLALEGSGDTRIRFVPNANYNSGPEAMPVRQDSIWFYLWDQETGTNGGVADVSSDVNRGGSTGYSLDTAVATIQVKPVNDEPSFTTLNDTTVYSSEISISFPGYINFVEYGFAGGERDEDSPDGINAQVINEVNIVNDNNALFTTQPDISNDSTLTFDIATNAEGTATVTLSIQDNGGVLYGGDDTSPDQTFDIRVIDDEGPKVDDFTTDATPADNTIGLDPSPLDMSFTFNEDVTPVSGRKIRIYNAAGPTLVQTIDAGSSQVSVSGATVDVSLSSYLEKGKSYYVNMDEGAFLDKSPQANPSVTVNKAATWNFTVADAAPAFVSLSPLDDVDSVPNYTDVIITFDEPVFDPGGTSPTIDIDYTGGPGADITIEADQSTMGASITGLGNDTLVLVLPDIDDGYDVVITFNAGAFEDASGNPTSDSTLNFTTNPDGSDPLITLTQPSDAGDFVTVNQDESDTVTRLYMEFDDDIIAGIGNIRLYADTDSGNVNSEADQLVFDIESDSSAVTYDSISSPATVAISLSDLGVTFAANMTYYVQIDSGAFTDEVLNPFNGIDNNTTWNFNTESTDGDTPDVVTLYPADNQSEVSLTPAQLRMTFDEPIQLSGSGYIRLHLLSNNDSITAVQLDSANANVTITNGVNLTVNLPVNLSSLTGYYVKVDTGAITDFSSPVNKYAGILNNAGWNFSTELADDGQSPAIVTTVPENGETDVSVNTSFVITFDEQVYRGADTDSITLRNASNDTIATIGIADVEIDGNQVTLPIISDLIDSLEYNTAYHFVFDDSVFIDASQNKFAEVNNNSVWEFTTLTDEFNPILDSITLFTKTGNTYDLLDGISVEEDSLILRLVFTEEVTADATRNGEIQFFFKDQNFPFINGDSTFSINTHDNGPNGSGIKFIRNVSYPTRIIEIDLSVQNMGADSVIFPYLSEFSIDIDSGAFIDTWGAPNTYQGLNQSNNIYTFDVINNDIVTPDSIPWITSYEPASLSAVHTDSARLGTNIIIDFSEPVNAQDGLISVNFMSNDGANRNGTDFTLDVTDGVASNAKTRYTFTIPENLKGSSHYYLVVPDSTFQDLGSNELNDFDDFIAKNHDFITAPDVELPVIESVTDSAFNVLSSTASGVQLEEDSVILYVTFSEPVTSTSTVDENGRISFFYKDQGFRADYVGDTVIYNTDGDRGTAIKFVDNFTDRTLVTTPTRYVIIDLVATDDTLAVDNDYSLNIDQNSFIDASGNKYFGLDQSNNRFTFSVIDDADITDIRPEIVRYFAADTTLAGFAELGSNIVVDFTEPVSPVTSATINVRFATDGNNDRGGVDFVLNAEDGVGSLANTRYTYTLPENFKGSANYYLEFAVNTFQDASTNQILAYDDFDDQDYLFTTVSDGVAPFIESVTDTSGNSLAASGLVQLDEDSVILYITFSEPVTSTATDGQNGRIIFFY
ncbi:MAG: Ig-like domain-containing protein [Cyclobacteriaceae bacterium]